MSTLGAENAQLKLALDAAQNESAAISEERDALEPATPAATESTSATLIEELERLRKEKRASELALQEESRNRLYKRPFSIRLIWRLVLYV